MVSTWTANKSIEKPANGDYVDTWSTPLNADWDIVDAALGGVTSLSVTGASGTTTLSAAQYRPPVLKISGTLTANVVYQLPSGVGGFWFIQNTTTGAFTVTIKSAGGGATVNPPQGYNTPVVSDGTNIAVSITQPSSVAAAGANAQIQYNSGGTLGASSSLTWNSGTNTLSATNFAGNLTGNVTGTVTGSVTGSSGSCTGNAATATSASTAATLSGILATTLGGTGGNYANLAAIFAAMGGQKAITLTSNGNGLAFGIVIGGSTYYFQSCVGPASASRGAFGTVTYPIAFSATPRVFLSSSFSSADTASGAVWVLNGTPGLSSCSVGLPNQTDSGRTVTCTAWAVGLG